MTTHRKTNHKDQMLKYLMDKLGMDPEDVQREIFKDRLLGLARQGKTIGEMIEVATKEGWLSVLHNTRFTDLSSSRKTTSGRMSREESERMELAILDFLKDNPNTTTGQIADAISFPTDKVRARVGKLKKAGTVKGTGEKQNMVYSLKK